MPMPSYMRPVGAGDGCGTVTLDAAAMARKIVAMETRIEALGTALLKIREIALAAAPSETARINEIAKGGFRGPCDG